jgi:hypothetical protein
MWTSSKNVLVAVLGTVLVGSTLRTGAAPRRAIIRSAQADAIEAQLPPVDRVWRQHGWHAVVPHAYALRRQTPVRLRPSPDAPLAFWLPGGTRVPVLEQRRQWWRIGGTRGRAGWVSVADLEPHASVVLIDVQTGRVRRRLAGKGEQGSVAAGGCLWSLSDTGLARTSLGEPPAIWSNPVRPDPHGSLPDESVWTSDRTAFFLDASSAKVPALAEVMVRTGTVRLLAYPARGLRLVHADATGKILLNGLSESSLYLAYDTRRSQRIGRAIGQVRAVARSGFAYAVARYPGGKRELIRYDPDLKQVARLQLPGDLYGAYLSSDDRVLAVSYATNLNAARAVPHLELLRADSFAPVISLAPDGHEHESLPRIMALAGGSGGWSVLIRDHEVNTGVMYLERYDAQGRLIHSWDAPRDTRYVLGSGFWAVSPDGSFFYVARPSDILVVNNLDGTARTIPFTWRRPLPANYLPHSKDRQSPTHLEVSALTLTPDGRTLVLTEYLNGDPHT